MASWMQKVMEYLPVGIRFHPTDEELLDHYLRNKTLGLDDPDCAIPEVDLCQWEPEELRAAFIQQSIVQSRNLEWWFFSEQKPGPTQNRSTKGGYWKKTGPTRNIKSRNDTKQVIGSKKILIFFRGNNSNSRKTHWVMHEYLLSGNALDGHARGDRKNYVVCKIRCNSDEKATSAPSCEGEQDELIRGYITDLLEAEPDNGFIPPEDKIQEKMQSLKTSCINNNVNPNQHPIPMLSPDLTCNSSLSGTTEWSFGRESLSSRAYICESSAPRQQQTVTMDNKQTPKVKSLHGAGQLDKKKGIIKDDSTQSTASSLQNETSKLRRKKKLPQIISDVPSEAKAPRDTPIKIKEEIIGTSSSSTSTHKPREEATATRSGRHRIAANTTRKEDTDLMAASTRELELMLAKPRSCSRHSSGRCSCRDLSAADYLLLLVVVPIIAILAQYLVQMFYL